MNAALTSLENFGNSLLAPITDPFRASSAAAAPVPQSPTPIVIPANPTQDAVSDTASRPIGVVTSLIPVTTAAPRRSSASDDDVASRTRSADSEGTTVDQDTASSVTSSNDQPSPTTFATSILPSPVPPPAPINPTASDEAVKASSDQNSGNGVSTAGIVVAVVIAFAMFATFLWLLFRFCPPIRRWWEARRETKRENRSYREALDGPRSSDDSYTKENYTLPYAHTNEEKATARRTFIERVRRSRLSRQQDPGTGLGLGPVSPIRAHPDFNNTPRSHSQVSLDQMSSTDHNATPATEEVISTREMRPHPPPKNHVPPRVLSPASPVMSERSTARVSQIGLALSSPSEARTMTFSPASTVQRPESRKHARFSFEPEPTS